MSRHNRQVFFTYFLSIFFPLTVVAGTFFLIIYYNKSNHKVDTRRYLDKKRIKILQESITVSFNFVVSDLMVLAETSGLDDFWKTEASSSLERANRLFLSFSEHKKLYDQIRFIDEMGMEVVRINFNNGVPAVVPDERLQNKAHRYYFKETYRLDKGEVFVSKLDLNIERGEVERPLKPMIRFGTPVFDEQGRKRGIIVLNCLAATMLKVLEKKYAFPLSSAILLDPEGYWLKGQTVANEFGFMFPSKKGLTFGNSYPEVWRQVSTADSGQIHTPAGLFTFLTIYPFLEVKTSTIHPITRTKTGLPDYQKSYYWKLVLQVDQALFDNTAERLLFEFLSWFVVVLIILGGISLILAHSIVVREMASEQRNYYEKKLARSEQRYREIVQFSNSIIVKIDANFNFIFMNMYGLEFFGYSEDEIMGKNLIGSIAPTHESTGRSLEKMLDDFIKYPEQHETNENENVKKNGERVWIAWKNKFTYDENDNLKEVLCVGYDITKRKQMEKELQKANEIINRSHVVAFRWKNATGWPIEYVSDNVVKMSGYTADTFTSGNISYSQIIYPDDLKQVEEEIFHYSNEKGKRDFSHRPYRITTKKGEIRWVSQTINIIRDENQQITTFEGIVHDITDQLKKDAELRKLSQVVHQSGSAIVVTDINGNIEFLNPAFTRITGYPKEEAIGHNPRMLNSGRHSHEFYQTLWNTISKGEIWRGEIINKKKSGELYWEYAIISPIKDSIGNIAHYVAIKEDISERKQMEEELLKAKQDADIASRTKSEFLANMSHELRTPLNAIIGFSQVLEHQIANQITEKQLGFFKTIRESGSHLLEMVNDILDLAKIEAGKTEVEMRPFDLGIMLERSPNIIHNAAYKKSLEIMVTIQPDLGWLNGDETKLKQVIYNLFSNAVKFTTFGKKIGLDATYEGDSFIISVWDEGIGISQEHLERIFNPFEQVTGSKTSKENGTGLGLAISRRLVELHQGTLTVSSEMNKGSRFTLTLPGRISFENQIPEQDEQRSDNQPSSLTRETTILAVEDNLSNRELLKEVLKEYPLDFAVTGEEAILKSSERAYDLILMDIQLPEMSGIEAMRRIKKNSERKIPVIALTAFAMKGDEEKYLSEGFDAYLSKPIDIELLEKKIETVLSVTQSAKYQT